MAYNFDIVTDRRNTGSLKWEVSEQELPMWVADMDFQAAPAIRDAIADRLKHGIFGYSIIPDEWYEAYIGWWRDRHGFTMEKEWLIFTTGVVPAISSAVRRLTAAGENVLVQTPCYNIFFNSIHNNGRNIVENRLLYKDGGYMVDWDMLERQLSEPQTSLMILSNPQNPVGKVWDRETLVRIGELCERYHVTVISDEIHCDLTNPGVEYIPFASVSELCKRISVTCIAPTKAFNIAGIQSAAVSVPDEALRHKIWRGLNNDEVAEPNIFATDVAVAAFTGCGDWLDELREYLYVNKQTVYKFICERLPVIKVLPCEATYLMWLDCTELAGKDICS
ncbi:MAG: PatB family C-S lyase, partial [Lachnospiraceae bacterium]|nr:PatB family C-S lyase [Lachnospiraceae bacterium]